MAEAKKTVVVIEDESEMIDLVRLILERRGLKVVGALTGREGLETIRRVKPEPDLARLDAAGYGRLGSLPANQSRPRTEAHSNHHHSDDKYQSIDDVIKRYLS